MHSCVCASVDQGSLSSVSLCSRGFTHHNRAQRHCLPAFVTRKRRPDLRNWIKRRQLGMCENSVSSLSVRPVAALIRASPRLRKLAQLVVGIKMIFYFMAVDGRGVSRAHLHPALGKRCHTILNRRRHFWWHCWLFGFRGLACLQP